MNAPQYLGDSIDELFENLGQPPRVEADEHAIYLRTSEDPDAYGYDIWFDQLMTVEQILSWGRQLAPKTWMTPKMLQAFYALALGRESMR